MASPLAEARGAGEVALLGAQAEAVRAVATVVLEPGEVLSSSELAGFFQKPTWVLVRTSSTSDASFAALVLVDPDASPAAALDAALSCADACFGVSNSRFASTLSERAKTGVERGADEALGKLGAASGTPLPAPSWDRVAYVIARARTRAPRAELLLQAIESDNRYATVTSRDPRTGQGPVRVAVSASPRALHDFRAADQDLQDCDSLGAEAKTVISDLVGSFETRLARPVRASFVVGAAVRVVGVTPLRRFGLGAFALAADLLKKGAIDASTALDLIEAKDVAAAVELSLEIEPGATVVKGIAAGVGIVEGIVCLSPSEVLEVARAGFTAIWFAHEIFPDDIDALRASGGVVTVRGGLTGEAAVMARGLAKPCIASGAALSLASDHVRIVDGGVFARMERVTIDGSTGILARGAHPLSIAELPAQVSAVLRMADERGSGVIASVSAPAHVITAARLGASGIALSPAEILLERETALQTKVSAIFSATKGNFARVHLRPWEAATPQELEAFIRACSDAAAATGVALEEPLDASLAICAPADVLAARLTKLRPPG